MRRVIALMIVATSLAGCGAVPDNRTSSRPTASQATVPSQTSLGVSSRSAEDRLCFADLGQSGARFSALPDRHIAPGCHQLGTVQIAQLSGDAGTIAITNLGPLACSTAQTLSAWTRYGVDRAARRYLGSPIARIETMGSYSCRTVAGTARLSAHSRAEAVDISAFVLEDGRRISVQHGWSGGSDAEREFLRVIHRSACKRFGTVLGPDYNSAHRDHFHFEGRAREGQGSAFCR